MENAQEFNIYLLTFVLVMNSLPKVCSLNWPRQKSLQNQCIIRIAMPGGGGTHINLSLHLGGRVQGQLGLKSEFQRNLVLKDKTTIKKNCLESPGVLINKLNICRSRIVLHSTWHTFLFVFYGYKRFAFM